MNKAEDLTLQSEGDILGRLSGIFIDTEAKKDTICKGIGLQDCQIQPRAG